MTFKKLDPIQILNHLTELLSRSIVVIGDMMLDEYHWCTVQRISPEAPVPVCRVQQTTLVPGGAANVAHNLVTLGSTPTLLGVIGNDSAGEKLLKKLEDSGVCASGIIATDQKPTTLKSRIIAHQQHIVRVDQETLTPISVPLRKQLFQRFSSALSHAQAVIISDYGKGGLPPTFLKQLIETATAHQIPVIIDPKGDDYSRYKGATVLTPNFGEFLSAVKKSHLTESEILQEGLKLIQRLQLDALVITRSEKGMSIILANGKKMDIPTVAKDVFDITGAGDTVLATLSLGISAGWTIQNSAYLANYSAGNVVAKVGTATTTLEEIKQCLSEESS